MADVYIDVDASLRALGRQHAAGAMKVWEDLERYEAVIAATQPEVIIETGTYHGGSACWFVTQDVDVVTVDVTPVADEAKGCSPRVVWVVGDSIHPDVAAMVSGIVRGRRTMVVLDSSHKPYHVQREIELYGPLVTPGCYLVVEDTIIHWVPNDDLPMPTPGPLEAVEVSLVDNPQWIRDVDIEAMHPVSMYPMGWWRRA